MREFGWFAVIAGAVIFEALTAPGTDLSGRGWRLTRSSEAGKVHLTLERSRPGNRTITGSDVPLANFQGFSLNMLDHSGPAKFTYVQDAATLDCVGKYGWGRGTGSFSLTPNPQFAAELSHLGFAPPSQDDLFLFLVSGTTLDYVREVHDTGIATSLSDLMDLMHHGVNAQYIHEMARVGYPRLKADDYIALRDHGVEARFMQALKDAGYQIDAGDAISLKDHGVDSEYVRALGSNGLHPDPQDLIAMRDHGVAPDFLRALRDADYDALRADEIIALHDHGVPRDFVLAAHDLGYRFSPNDVVELHDHGVGTDYLRSLHDSGMRNLKADQIVQLHDHGVQ